MEVVGVSSPAWAQTAPSSPPSLLSALQSLVRVCPSSQYCEYEQEKEEKELTVFHRLPTGRVSCPLLLHLNLLNTGVIPFAVYEVIVNHGLLREVQYESFEEVSSLLLIRLLHLFLPLLLLLLLLLLLSLPLLVRFCAVSP